MCVSYRKNNKFDSFPFLRSLAVYQRRNGSPFLKHKASNRSMVHLSFPRMNWLQLRGTTDAIQDRVVIDCVVAANADADFDHAELYCFVGRRIYL